MPVLRRLRQSLASDSGNDTLTEDQLQGRLLVIAFLMMPVLFMFYSYFCSISTGVPVGVTRTRKSPVNPSCAF